MAARQWTVEQRAWQAAQIRQWQPWTKSTGARTVEGKAISSRNAIIGFNNRQKAIEDARKAYKSALANLLILTGKDGKWYELFL